MTTTTTTTTTTSARRPRDRKAQIAQHASELFATHGFHSVRMDDIAAATGITARALYRHYENKQTLLSHVVREDQNRLLAALGELRQEAGATAVDPEDHLRVIVDAALRGRRLSLLWQREARYLNAEDYAHVREAARRIADEFRTVVVAGLRPDLDPTSSLIRSWAALSLLMSPGHHDLAMAAAPLAELLLDAGRRVITAPPTSADSGGEPGPTRSSAPVPASRREQLLSGAASAFRRSGYAGASIDDIGAGAGVVGPALYRYFDSKQDLLVAATCRYLEWVAHENARALRSGAAPEDMLVTLVKGYIRVALEATDLLAVTVTESLHLPDGTAERVSRMRGDDLAEWARWLGVARPGIPEAIADVLVSAARTLIDDLARIPQFRQDPGFEAKLRSAALAVLSPPRDIIAASSAQTGVKASGV
ncbi:TetR/AcrR family transcriptional regulator [Blastococcus tunisiensis]|uniref:DNA-binding transcriptional regulator, AcrR family n=1 Tax=Blastococcus tunisiensis TaxID=1798228 RepID=A0A1I2KSG8_9ACTN|nr:TetR/AcrR family transcriptional regulator [Blastococcus sp. DSM 46838]SFF68137.1 DNA-binding transcriptional regulator, AcrR family [Blastococcus sp. DSM 46838]